MNNLILIKISSIPIWCAALVLTLFSCCTEDSPRPHEKEPFRWEWENRDFLPFNPYYEDGYYYIFTVPWASNLWSLTKVKETNGEIIYNVPIRDNVDNNKFDCFFREGDRLMMIEGNFIHQINMNTGSIVTDTFSNYIWDFVKTEDQLTACSWTNNYNTYKFYEIKYVNGHYRESLIHSEDFIRTSGFTNDGTPPIYSNGKWIMAYATGNLSSQETSNFLIIKEGENVNKILIDSNSKGYSFNSILVDDNSYYVFAVDKLFSFSRNDGSVNWQTPIDARSYSVIKDDYIYILDGSDVYKLNIINRRTGIKEVYTVDPCWQGKIVGDYLCWSHGNFNKFNLKTKQTEHSSYIPIPIVGEGSWGTPFGASEKSVLLHDGLKFECFPF